jgi:hypothetical protein
MLGIRFTLVSETSAKVDDSFLTIISSNASNSWFLSLFKLYI